MKFPDKCIAMCKEYISLISEWPDNEQYKVDGIHMFQIWTSDTGVKMAAIVNMINGEWQLINATT